MAGKVRKLTISEGTPLAGAPTPDLIPAEDVSFDPTGTQFASVQVQALGEEIDDILDLKADLVGGLVPANQLPSYVDDVIEAADFASLPVTGEQGKIYVTLDTNFTYRWTGSIYVLLGGDSGGGSGSGEINYITNPDAETDTSGWAEYDDGTEIPIDGDVGPAANLTFTRQNVTVIRGEFSFQIAKAGANAQGEGMATDFTIDAADQNKLLKISFDYNTDGTYTDEDMKVYIYDVTNDVLITPADNGIIGKDKDDNSSGSRTIGWASTNSLEYRLLFHVAEATSNTWDLYFDNVIVGPGSVATGAVVTAWEDFIPSATNAFPTGKTILYKSRRVGDSMIYRIQVPAGGTTGTGTITWDLPTGQTVDSSQITVGSGIDAATGYGLYDNNSTDEPIYGIIKTTTQIGLYRESTGTTTLGGADTDTRAHWFETGPIPIAEFAGSGTVNLMSDNVAAANVWGSWTMTTTGYTGSGDTNPIDFDTEVSNFMVGSWANTNGSITIPADGVYEVNVKAASTTPWPASADLRFIVGGTNVCRLDRNVAGTTTTDLGGSYKTFLSKGDVIHIASGSNATFDSNTATTNLQIVRIADYSAGQPVGFGIATADTYGLVKTPPKARYYRGSTQALTEGSEVLIWDNEVYNVGGVFSNSSGSITVSLAGYVRLDLTCTASSALGIVETMGVYLDGSSVQQGPNGLNTRISFGTEIAVTAGQVITVRAIGGSFTVGGSATGDNIALSWSP